jgi:carboxypeptidase family protein
VKRSHLGAMLSCILLSCSFAFGQSATTSLRGTIKDPSGALVPNATVTITDKTVDKTVTAVSNGEGSYQFPQIPPAHYLITVTAQGLGSQSKTAELLVNQPATIDFTLSIEASTVTMDVSASAQTLNTTDATIGNSVGNETIQALPMEGRDPISLLTLQPGVLYLGNPAENDTLDSRSGSVNGGRSDQGNITLDGMDDNDQIAGTAFTGVLRSTLDSTEEFRVTTSNGTADSGRSSGAQISLVTKTGTNSLHGALYEYYRPTNTVANAFFNKHQQLDSDEPNVPQKYVLNTFGGAVGGPIKKDKLFFFFNYEGLRQAVSDIVTATLPTQAFYNGQLGYNNAAGGVSYLDTAQVAALDSDCTTNIPCGVNPNVQAYFAPLAAKGQIGAIGQGGDGINYGNYVFVSPAPLTHNTSILKLDYELTSKQRIFARGNLQKDTLAGDENLPGQPASTTKEDNTKGFTVGHTWTPTANLVNDLRYAYIRQGYAINGVASGQGDWVFFRALTQPEANGSTDYSTKVNVPVNNITDNLTWTKGKHTLTFGGNWRNIENNRGTDANSYSGANSDPYWMSNDPNEPADFAGGTANYKIAYGTLMGTVPLTNQQYNYTVDSATSGSLLKDGAFIDRHFKANEFEYYLQDSWRVKPNLTLTFGLRHSLLQAPYESKGQQVAPTVDTHNWFIHRGDAAAQGAVFEDPLTFKPSGKANGAPGYWAKQKLNIAPRLAAVYSPDAKTTFRVGAGMYFDHFGQGIVNAFDQEGSFGLTSTVTGPASTYTFQNSPRFTGAHEIPPLAGSCGLNPTVTYPYSPANDLQCGFAITWGIDNHLKTPYSYALDFSFQHQFPGGFTFEENYVGRLGRHLLQQLDLAEPVNLSDPQGAGDYFHAAQQLSRITDQNGDNPNAAVAKIPYFEDMFPNMVNYDYMGESATQAVYSDEWAFSRDSYGETQALEDIDFGYGTSSPGRFWNQQFSSLYAWSSIGTSSYHALQMSLRHPTVHGLTVDANYTFSKSIDMGSGVERANWESTDAFGGAGGIQNSWNPKLNKAVSDFDTRHLITADWVYALPVGRGKALMGSSNRAVDALLGGWQFSGLTRWTSGLPFAFGAPGWATNWNLEGNTVATGPIKFKKSFSGGIPSVFDMDTSNRVSNGVIGGSPLRLEYPGENGERNGFRGDGYFDVDSSLSKTWKLPERATLKFAAEVYNIGNNVRFDVSPRNLDVTATDVGTLGQYSGVLTTYRRMQFGLRLDF